MVSTEVITTPVPADFSVESIKLLGDLGDADDETLNLDLVGVYLERKWQNYGWKSFMIQFVLYLTYLLTLIFYVSLPVGDVFAELSKWIALGLSVYFLLYEFCQMLVQGGAYFTDLENWGDLCRLGLVFLLVLDSDKNHMYLYPIMFLVVWIKLMQFLAVFKQLRYMVKMITETIKELSTFLIILVIAILAYSQIIYSYSTANPAIN